MSVDQPDRVELERTDRLIAAIDAWTSWACGRRVATASLATAVDTFVEVDQGPDAYSPEASDLRRLRRQSLIEPVASALPELGILSQPGRRAKDDHKEGLGIDR